MSIGTKTAESFVFPFFSLGFGVPPLSPVEPTSPSSALLPVSGSAAGGWGLTSQQPSCSSCEAWDQIER